MKKGEFEYLIGSPFDREKLICEIYYNKELLAEISQEDNNLMIELYPPKSSNFWIIPLSSLQEALEFGKNHLLGKK